MGWEADNRYRLRGYYAENEEAQVMMFDLSEPEIQVPVKDVEIEPAKPDSESRSITEIRNQSVWVRSEMDANSGADDVGAQERQHEPTGDVEAPLDKSACEDDMAGSEDERKESQKQDNKIIYEWEYPEHWKHNFGMADGEKTVIFMRLKKYRDNWDILCPTVTVEGHQSITADVLKGLAEDAGKIISEEFYTDIYRQMIPSMIQ